MTLSSIATKLRALRAVAENAGATQGERDNALSLYEELLRKYHLDASELDLRAEGTEYIRIQFDPGSIGFAVANEISNGVAKFAKCKIWQGSRSGFIKVLGLQSDAQFAEWLIKSLVHHVQREATTYALDSAAGAVFKNDMDAFSAAAAARIKERLLGMVHPDAPGTALVVVRNKMIDEAFEALGISLKPATKGSFVARNSATLDAGRAAGDRASFAKPTGYSKPLALPAGARK